MAKEYTGEAGTIYVEEPDDGSTRDDYEVWFEDFCIIGTGKTESEALQSAAIHTGRLSTLILTAMVQSRTKLAVGNKSEGDQL